MSGIRPGFGSERGYSRRRGDLTSLILADHCVFGTTLRLLRAHGYPVTALKEIAPIDTPDEDLLRLAVGRGCVLLTNDQDFCDIIRYPPSAHSGVIVLRMIAAHENRVHEVLLRMLKERGLEFGRILAVVTSSKYRLRR